MLIECLQLLVGIDHANAHVALHRRKGQSEHGLELHIDLAVLHSSAIVALILMFQLLLVFHHQLVVLVGIDLAALTHLSRVETRLLAVEMLVEARLIDGELVALSLLGHAQTAIAGRTELQARPEIGKLIDHLRIVTDGSLQVARLVEQDSAVEECHDIVRLKTQHKIEIGDGTVVIAHLRTQQATVIMSQEVVGFDVKCQIIVGHRTAQVVLIDAGQRTVDIVACMLRLEVDGLVETLLSFLPFLTREMENAACRPDRAVVGVYLQTLLDGSNGRRGVFLLHKDVGPHHIGRGITLPTHEHGVNLSQRCGIVIIAQIAEHTVVAQASVLGVILQRHRVVADRLTVFLLLNTGKATQLIDADHVGIAVQSLGAVLLGSHKIVEIVFGHAPEKPRFIEIGLGRDGLIEILHREHIVLIVEGRASDGQQAISVVLGETN